MSLQYEPQANVLILPGDSPESDEPVVNTADVLRQIRTHHPKALLVWLDANDLEARAELISEIHRRCPKVALIALAGDHDDELERSARIAGASYYFPLINENDQRVLNEALSDLGIALPTPTSHSGLSPPRRLGRQPRSRESPAPAAPTPQARGRPPRLFRR